MRPDAKTPSPSLPATLELANAVRLAGNVCLLDDGTLQLSSSRVMDDAASSSNFTMPAEKDAVLNLGSLRDHDGFIDNVDVVVSFASGTTLGLTLRDPEGTVEQRCLKLLPGYRAEDESLDNNTEELAGDNLQVFKKQSTVELEKLLKKFLGALSDYLRQRSLKSRQVTSGENVHYEAMNAIRENGLDITFRVSEKIDEYFQDLTPRKESDRPVARYAHEGENLDLVDIK